MVSLAKERGLSASSEESLLKKFPEVTHNIGWMDPGKSAADHFTQTCQLDYMGDEKLPIYIGIVIMPLSEFPINQPVMHGMSLVGFNHCSIDGSMGMVC